MFPGGVFAGSVLGWKTKNLASLWILFGSVSLIMLASKSPYWAFALPGSSLAILLSVSPALTV